MHVYNVLIVYIHYIRVFDYLNFSTDISYYGLTVKTSNKEQDFKYF